MTGKELLSILSNMNSGSLEYPVIFESIIEEGKPGDISYSIDEVLVTHSSTRFIRLQSTDYV